MVRCESHGSASSVCLYHSYYRVCQVCIQKMLKPERKTLIYSIKDDKNQKPKTNHIMAILHSSGQYFPETSGFYKILL